MLKLSKDDNFSVVKIDESDMLEVILTTTYRKETDKGKIEETHSVKTYDVDIDRAYSVLSRAMTSYFAGIRDLFNGDDDVKDKGNEVSTA